MPRQHVALPPSRRAKAAPGQYSERKATRASFRGALDEEVRQRQKRVNELAEQYKRSKPYVRSQLYGGSKSARFARRALETRLYDAYFHWKAEEMNDGLEVGQKYGLDDIRKKITRERPNYKDRPAAEKQKWLAKYKVDKEDKAREKRRNRRGEQQDAASTLRGVSNDLDTLRDRTGVRAVVFAVRSDILATTEPFLFCDNDFTNFFSTALGKTPDQIARLLEMWSIHGPSSLAAPPPKNAAELKSEVRRLIQTGLDAIIAKCYEGAAEVPTPGMNYVSYDSEIEGEHGVRFVGWTMNNGIKINPGELTMADARALYKGLVDKSIYWELVPEDERGAAPVKKKRKTRSDKGGTHKKAAKTADASDAASTSRRKSKPSAKDKGKSKAATDSDSDSGDDSGDDSGSE